MAEEDNTFDDEIRMRVRGNALKMFKKKSQTVHSKKYTDLLRELIDAFNEGRLRIVQTEESREAQKELYHD